MAMPPQDQRPEWLPSGFPPRSFPAGPPASAPAAGPDSGPGAPAGRGRWLAAIAALLALILLAGGLFAATRGGDDDEEGQLATGPSTTQADTSFPTFDTSTTLPAATTISIAPVTTAAAATSTTAPTSTAAAGLLEVAPATLVLARTDATAGATRGTVTVRNVGGSPLTFTAQSSIAGLTASPARGNLAAGATAGVTVTLDASRIPAEGPFSGTVSFGGTGGARTIQVSSTTGRPPEFTDDVGETCATPTTTCSRQIRLDTNPSVPNPSPCNTAWAYAVTITDQSQITNARAIARRNVSNADAVLQQAAGTNIFISNSYPPLGSGTLRFALEATDVHGFTRRLPEQTIAC